MGTEGLARADRVRRVAAALFLVAAVVLLLGGRANAAVLYDQVDTTSPESTNSQDFETVFDSFDGMVADDFTVPAGHTWRLESVLFRGTAVSPTSLPSAMRVTLFSDSSGAPGAEISSRLASINPGSYPRPEAQIGDQPSLAPGTYWLGAQAVLDAGNFSGPQWFWADSDEGPFGNPAFYRNPGGGFDSVCASFQVRSTCLFPDSFHPSHDQSFSLSGTDTPDAVGPSAACLAAKAKLAKAKATLKSAVRKLKKAKGRVKKKKAAKAVKKAKAAVRSADASVTANC